MDKNNTLQINFGKKLQKMRLDRKLSQEKLAIVSDLHPTYISQAERGKRNISLSTLKKLSTALGCTLSELLDDVDSHQK